MTKATYGDTLYAALGNDSQDIFRSDDQGRSWQMVGLGPQAAINALAVNPINEQVIYAGTAGGAALTEGSLWLSDDEGESWRPYGLNLPVSAAGRLPAVSVLAVDINHPGLLYVGTEGQGLYRFQINHKGYELVGGVALRDLYIEDIVISPDGQVYVLTTESLLTIQGDGWRKISTLPDLAVSLAIDPANPQTLYAGTVGYGAYRSADGGQTWESINTDLGWKPGIILQVSAVAVDEDAPTHLALATAYGVGSRWAGGGIFESDDAGQSWARLGTNGEVVDHLTIKAGGVYAATAQGLVRHGEPLPPAPWVSRMRNRSLSNPTGVQEMILVLTIVLAGWMLLGRPIRVTSQSQKPA